MTKTRSTKKTASNKSGKEEDVSDLPKALMSKSPKVRKQALERLCQDVVLLESPEIIEQVTDSLSHSDPELRVNAARAIAKHMIRVQVVRYEEAEEDDEYEDDNEDDEAEEEYEVDEDEYGYEDLGFDDDLLDQISPLLNDKDPQVRKQMAQIFYDLALEYIENTDSICKLAELLDGEDEETTELALRAIEVLATHDYTYCDHFKEALEPVLEFIGDDNGQFLDIAINILAHMAWNSGLVWKSRTPRFIDLLKHEDKKIALSAAYILGTIVRDGADDERCTSILDSIVAQLSGEVEQHTRGLVYVLYVLAHHGVWSDKAVKPLLELSVNDSDPRVQGHAFKALAFMATYGCMIERSELDKRWAIFKKIREEYEGYDFSNEDEYDDYGYGYCE